jgi:hypothetical protein
MRNLAYRAAQVARRETKYDFPAFDPWEKHDPESDTLAVIKVENSRVIGLIPLAKFADDAVTGWHPTEGDEVPTTSRRTVEMIWALQRCRGGGVRALELVNALCGYSGTEVEFLAHEAPFTMPALRFWQKHGLERVYIA